MKRYLLFAGDTYYPNGGWYDYLGSFDTTEDCLRHIAGTPWDWWHIYDTKEQLIVLTGP